MNDTRKPTPVEAAVSRLVEAETALDALRKVLDKHRRDVQKPDKDGLAGMYCSETDEEVVERLAGTGLISPPVGTTVTDQHGYVLGVLRNWSAGTVVVATSGSAVAPKPPTPKMPTDTRQLAMAVSTIVLAKTACVGTYNPVAAYDAVESEIRAAFGLPGARAGASPPKPVRLHCGQVWRHKDGTESAIGNALPPTFDAFSRGGEYRMVGSKEPMFVYGDWTVRDANGWVLVWGPGAPPFDTRTP